jgi:hypothetical protein
MSGLKGWNRDDPFEERDPVDFERPENYDDSLSPVLDIDDEELLVEEKGVDPNMPRYLFSPMRDLITKHDLCGHDLIRACAITILAKVPYLCQNYDANRFSDDARVSRGVQEVKTQYRKAVNVANGLMDEFGYVGTIPTGVCLFDDLLGLEPKKYQDDVKLIIDLQKTVLPYRPKTAAEQIDFLNSRRKMVEGLPYVKASNRLETNLRDLYSSILERMISATETALAYGEVHVENLKFELNERAQGHIGYKGRVNRVDKFICGWIGQPVPEISTRLVSMSQPQPTQMIQQPQSAAPFDPNMIAAVSASVIMALKESGLLGHAAQAPPPVVDNRTSSPAIPPVENKEEKKEDMPAPTRTPTQASAGNQPGSTPRSRTAQNAVNPNSNAK